MSLDVKGEVGQATPIDVLLIVDRSSSMNETSGGYFGKTRMQIVNGAISQLVSKLKTPDVKTTINISIVGFQGQMGIFILTTMILLTMMQKKSNVIMDKYKGSWYANGHCR